MRYLLLMTLAGSILYEAYLLWIKLGEQYISQGMKYKALIIVLLLYTVPLVWLKEIYRVFLRFMRPVEIVGGEDFVSGSAISTGVEVYPIQSCTIGLLLFITWLAIALLMMLKQSANYFRHKRDIRRFSENCSNEENIKKVMQSLKKELHCIRKIEVLRIKGEGRSYTLGILRPIIVLQENYTEEELEWLLRHEMVHIAKGDLIVNWWTELVRCMHWFNPIVRTVKREVDIVSELSCDERASGNHDFQEREVYARLVNASMQYRIQRIFGCDFGSNPNVTEQRLRIILKTKKIKKWKKLVAASLFLVLVLADSMLVLAYSCKWHL